MRKSKSLEMVVILLWIISLCFACLPETRTRIVVGPEGVEAPHPLLPADQLDDRIASLSNLVETQELDEEDHQLAMSLLSTYKAIRQSTENRGTDEDHQKIIRLLYENLGRIEEKYFLRTKPYEAQYPDVLHLFTLERKRILDDYLSRNYQGVIEGCLKLENRFGPDSLTPDLGLLFAISLAEQGMTNEAIRVGEKIIRELGGKPDLVDLRANIIEWYLALGDRKQATQIYEKWLDTLDEQEALLKKAKHRLSGQAQNMTTPESATEKLASLGRSETEEPASVEDILSKVDELVKRHQFERAKFLLIQQRIRSQEGPLTEIIDEALKSVELAEDRYHQEERARAALREETLKTAARLIEEEKYEDAISRLEILINGQTGGPKADALKALAIEKLINRERNRAAKLFLMARQTTEPSKKEKLLRSSHNILKALAEKYPTSPLNKKINDHIIRIEEELEKLRHEPG
ncbi:MAG: hypothetical protein PVG99_07745 [Desulfobacteraceae bacterium]|jgi:hypothetical protein